MENEKLFDFMEKIYLELQNTRQELQSTRQELQSTRQEMQNGFNSVDEKIDSLEAKIDKNTMLLEKANSDIKTLAEVQQSFSEELGRSKDKEGKTLGERLDIIELAVSNTSKLLNQSFDKLNGKIDDLQIDVNTLTSKTAKTDSKVIQFERILTEIKQG